MSITGFLFLAAAVSFLIGALVGRWWAAVLPAVGLGLWMVVALGSYGENDRVESPLLAVGAFLVAAAVGAILASAGVLLRRGGRR
jgi:hypothetical protein